MSDSGLIGLGTEFEMDTVRWLREAGSGNPRHSLDYLSRRYDLLVTGRSEEVAPQLLTRHSGQRGLWVSYDPVADGSAFYPTDQIQPDIGGKWGSVTDYYRGRFFGRDRGALITVACTLLYDGDSNMRSPVWRYVTGRELKKHDLNRLGIPEE